MKNPWKTIKKNIIYQNKFGYTLYDNDVITPEGKLSKFMVMEHPDFPVIVALTSDNKVIMIHQWRYIMDCECLELPAGSPNGNEDLLTAAKRELQEETGAVSENWQEIISFWIGTGGVRMKAHVYLAKNAVLTGKTNYDTTETIRIKIYPYPELLKLIDNGTINDDRSIIGLLWLKNYL